MEDYKLNKELNLVLFGCKSSTKKIFDFLIENFENVTLVTITEDNAKKNKVADFFNFNNSIENIKFVNTYSLTDKDDISFFLKKKFDVGFAIGWQRIIPEIILKSTRLGVFGMHGSAMRLPRGRGRSPLNWSIIDNHKNFFNTLFRYSTGIDDGKILDTYEFEINEHDTSETLHFKNFLSMKFLIKKNIEKLSKNDMLLKEQSTENPTYYPKRDENDSLINWNDKIDAIDRFIKAVTKPFNGAYTFYNNQKLIIYRANIFDKSIFGIKSKKFGEIVEIFPNQKFLIFANGGLLIVHEYKCKTLIKKGFVLNNHNQKKRIFDVNKFGNHDLEQ
tara:strand:+ start:3922 stop:4917 length:996 start_codon:yes stop_codon:yes gene_type:complete